MAKMEGNEISDGKTTVINDALYEEDEAFTPTIRAMKR